MGRLAGFAYRKIIKKLRKLGFVFDRQAAGSHEIWFNPETGCYTTIQNHPGDMPEGTLRAILKQANVSAEEFLRAFSGFFCGEEVQKGSGGRRKGRKSTRKGPGTLTPSRGFQRSGKILTRARAGSTVNSPPCCNSCPCCRMACSSASDSASGETSSWRIWITLGLLAPLAASMALKSRS